MATTIMMISLTLLQLELVEASVIAINSTYERDISDENFTEEEFMAANDSENVAFEKLDVILESIQTMEGLDEFEKCGYTTEMNPYKVLECYQKNKDKIK
ncbi:MAG TPA: hypothetical protein VE548_10525 [Nitrososphaeraceae archaeon]|nr:hypothetical protein [Nitrososphaeraceae archaeon]